MSSANKLSIVPKSQWHQYKNVEWIINLEQQLKMVSN